MPRSPLSTTRERVTAILLLLLALLGAGGVSIALTAGNPPAVGTTTPTTVATTPTVTQVDADGDGQRDDPLKVPPAAAAELDRTLAGTTPEGEPTSELADPLRGSKDTKDVGKLTGPLAADSVDGCRTRFVGNFSKRVYGPNPSVIEQHQTVSADRPGWADQDALTAQANRRSSGTSWHFLVGGIDGLCTYTVPLKYSAWTQANANSIAVGIEVQAVGNEPQYCTSKCRATLMKIYREIIARYPHIKLRRAKITWGSGCRPIVVQSGIGEHSELGPCGGGHADVTPWSISPLISYAAAYFARDSKAAQAAAAARGKTCNQLRYHRGKFATQPRGSNGSTTRKAWTERRNRINTLKARAKTQGLDEAKCRA